MSHNDDELNERLRPLRKLSPHDLQMKKWQAAVRSEARSDRKVITTTKSRLAIQLFAAMFIGFVMGAILFKNFLHPTAQSPLLAGISIDGATFEHSHANLD